jgi:hypothetical protein
MSEEKAPVRREVEVLQKQVAELQRILSEKRLGLDKTRPTIRVARTMMDGSYPGSTGTAFNLQFRDPDFTETDGAQALSGDFQDTEVQRVGLTIPPTFVADGTDVLVAEIDGRHYILGGSKCTCGGVNCNTCIGGKTPSPMEVTITGVTNGTTGTGGLDCAAAVNGTHSIEMITEQCFGSVSIPVGTITDATGLSADIGDELRVTILFAWNVGVTTKLGVQLSIESSPDGNNPWTPEIVKQITGADEVGGSQDCSKNEYVLDTLHLDQGGPTVGLSTITPTNFTIAPANPEAIGLENAIIDEGDFLMANGEAIWDF